MTDTYKVLGQKVTDGTSTPMYSVPEGGQSVISAIEITNAGNSTSSYSLSITRDNDPTKGIFLMANTFNDDTFLYSNDAINWTEVGKPFQGTVNTSAGYQSTNMNSLVVDKDIFYYAASGFDSDMYTFTPEIQIVSSTDGLNWSTIPAPIFDFYTVHRVHGMHVTNGIIVLVLVDQNTNYMKFYVSSDLGQNWTMTRDFGYLPDIKFYTYKDKLTFIFHGSGTQYQSSTDGITWQMNYTDGPLGFSLDLTFGKVNNTEIALAFRGDNGVYYSYNGNNFFQSSGFQDRYFQYIEFSDNGIYALVAYDVNEPNGYDVLYSSNGAEWSFLGTQPPYTFNSNYHAPRALTATNNLLISTGNNYYAYSDNLNGTLGTNWTAVSLEEDQPRDNWYTGQSIYKKTSTENFIVYEKSILSGQTEEIKAGITLSSKDSIDIQSVSNSIIANGYGVEIS